MNKFRVTCLHDEETRVFATSEKFKTRELAEKYAAGIPSNRKPMIGYVTLETEYTHAHWTVIDPDTYDGPESYCHTVYGLPNELKAIIEYCELEDRCTVSMNGVPCSGIPMSVVDEAGSGWKRCSGCSML